MDWIKYFEEKIKQVPLELQSAILSVDFLGGLRQIQKKYLLHIDQGNELEGATFRFMFGDIPNPDAFRQELADKLNIPPSLATTILEDVEKSVLAPIRQKLQEAEQESIEEAVEDLVTIGKTADGETYQEIVGEPLPPSASALQKPAEETLHTEDLSDIVNLSSADILKEIENPTPATGRTVTIESNIAQPLNQKPSEAPKRAPSFADVAAGFSASNTTPAAPTSSFNSKVAESLGISRPKESVAKTASVLQSAVASATASQKLTETTASKPKEINIPADPYRESF